MDLREALSVLSKSSPYAVTTAGESISTEFDQIKRCLYVETDIEKAFRDKLEGIQSGEIIFLCGSSGDGKSEILTRYKKLYEKDIDFHLDATHSFEPTKNAIDTLDSVFDEHKEKGRPLVVGINIGMLGNYEREGSSAHESIKKAIGEFLKHKEVVNPYIFLDFESFPKFTIKDGRVSSPFFSELLNNVVKDDSGNKFRDFFHRASGDQSQSRLCSNYLMLRNHHVQSMVVELLFNARIRKDQFVTARMLLDFIHCILTGPGYLFDNLFAGGGNELLEALADFDPSVIRNHRLDLFILHRTLGLADEELQVFLKEIEKEFDVTTELSAQSIIRMFYVLKGCDISNNYHRNFKASFNEHYLQEYKRIWEAHKRYSGDLEEKKVLRDFYADTVFKAINRYANRSAPYLSKDEFYLSSHGDCDLAAEMDLSVIYKSIEKDDSEDLSAFNVYLEVGGERISPVPVGLNLLILLMDIVDGYHPNKYDKNSVVLLDELITKITETAGLTDILHMYKEGHRIKLKANSDGEIRVSGI